MAEEKGLDTELDTGIDTGLDTKIGTGIDTPEQSVVSTEADTSTGTDAATESDTETDQAAPAALSELNPDATQTEPRADADFTAQPAQDAQPNAKPKDTKEYVTDYAFSVDPALLGKPIARPWRRAMAQAVDFVAIALLAQLPSPILGVLTSLAFLRASRKGNNNIRSKRAKWGLKIAGVMLLFIITVIVVDTMRTMEEDENDPDEQSVAQAIIYGANWMKWQDCSGAFDCQREIARGVGQGLVETGATRGDVETRVDNFLSQRQLTEEQRSTLRAEYLAPFPEQETELVDIDVAADQPANGANESEPADYSVVNWLQGFIANDLGLGLGWAALYHTLFVAWFGGRTLGKKLLKIRVVKLDGSEFSLWESFERYGGYGAGFATGLLGFVKVYWDANRQAIQDKISETVVIFEKK